MRLSKLIVGAIATGVMAVSASANAATITFDDLTSTNYALYQTVESGGFLFDNSFGNNEQLLVWGTADGTQAYNADPDGATLSNNYGSTTTTVAKLGGGLFDFFSIDLADVHNQARGGDVLFTFNTLGGSTSQTVTLDVLSGLQTFVFNKTGLTSFTYTPQTTAGAWIQVDNVVVDQVTSAAPEPTTWALMLLGFGGMGALLRRRSAAVA